MFYPTTLKREEIIRIAVNAKLAFIDGGTCYLNELAGEKELVAFARLLELKLHQALIGSMAGTE